MIKLNKIFKYIITMIISLKIIIYNLRAITIVVIYIHYVKYAIK